MRTGTKNAVRIFLCNNVAEFQNFVAAWQRVIAKKNADAYNKINRKK